MTEDTIQEDREEGLCDRCGKEYDHPVFTFDGEQLCSSCAEDVGYCGEDN